MVGKKVSKLKLNKETVRILSDKEQNKVVGGAGILYHCTGKCTCSCKC
jgi:natural product precursor